MTTVYLGKDSKGFRIKPGYLEVIGYECYINDICDKIGKSWRSIGGFASRCFIRVKAKHHIRRLQEIFPEIEITDDKLEQGMAIELPTIDHRFQTEYGWSPESTKRWNELVGSWSTEWRRILGLGAGTITYEETKRAFRKRVLETHPDRGGDKEEFQKVVEAWKFAKVYFGRG